jgi:hypothetical protein
MANEQEQNNRNGQFQLHMHFGLLYMCVANIHLFPIWSLHCGTYKVEIESPQWYVHEFT